MTDENNLDELCKRWIELFAPYDRSMSQGDLEDPISELRLYRSYSTEEDRDLMPQLNGFIEQIVKAEATTDEEWRVKATVAERITADGVGYLSDLESELLHQVSRYAAHGKSGANIISFRRRPSPDSK